MVLDVTHRVVGRRTRSDLHVLVFYLCLETFIRYRQYSAAMWDPALNLCCVFSWCIILDTTWHTAACTKKASSPAHSCCLSPETLWQLIWKRGSSVSSCNDEALRRRDTYTWPISTVCSGRGDCELDVSDSRQTSMQEQMVLRLHWGLCMCVFQLLADMAAKRT